MELLTGILIFHLHILR
jgi:hypothetical protein